MLKVNDLAKAINNTEHLVAVCPRCGKALEKETEVDGYPFVCTECDENFYSIEVDFIPESEVEN